MTQVQTLANIPGIGGTDGQPVANSGVAPGETKAPVLTPRERLAQQIETTAARIAKDSATLEELTARIEIIDTLDNITDGFIVEVKLGRADTTRVITGVVVGVNKEDAKNVKYKVYSGAGFDAEVVIVTQAQIVTARAPE